MYMWSSTNTWLRSIDRRSRYSGRSWCAIVAIDACSRATCDSSAIVTLSRKRRCTRVLTVRRDQVPALESARPIAAPSTRPGRCSTTPLPRSISQSASSASGSAASCDSTNAQTISEGSWRYPSLHKRHIDESAGGSGSMAGRASGEDVIRRALLIVWRVEALRLQLEHRAIAPAERHQFVVRPELDDPAALENTDPIRVAHGRETVRDQDRRAVARLREQSVEDLGFAAHVELGGRFVEQHHGGAELHGRDRARQRHALPLSAGEIGAALIPACEHGVERRQVRRAGRRQCGLEHVLGRAAWRDVLAQRPLEADEILKHGGDSGSPRGEIERPDVDAVDLDRAA